MTVIQDTGDLRVCQHNIHTYIIARCTKRVKSELDHKKCTIHIRNLGASYAINQDGLSYSFQQCSFHYSPLEPKALLS